MTQGKGVRGAQEEGVGSRRSGKARRETEVTRTQMCRSAPCCRQDRCLQRSLGAAWPSPCISGPFLTPNTVSPTCLSLPASPPHFQQQALSQTHSLHPDTRVPLRLAHRLLRRCPRLCPDQPLTFLRTALQQPSCVSAIDLYRWSHRYPNVLSFLLPY